MPTLQVYGPEPEPVHVPDEGETETPWALAGALSVSVTFVWGLVPGFWIVTL